MFLLFINLIFSLKIIGAATDSPAAPLPTPLLIGWISEWNNFQFIVNISVFETNGGNWSLFLFGDEQLIQREGGLQFFKINILAVKHFKINILAWVPRKINK